MYCLQIRSNIVRNYESKDDYYLVNFEYIAVHFLTYKLAFVINLVTEYNAKSTQDTAQHASLANLKLSCACIVDFANLSQISAAIQHSRRIN